MQFFTSLFLVTALPLLSLAGATVIEERAAAPSQYYLKTKIVNATGDTGTKKCDLYVASYHTGAGLGDAVLVANKTNGAPGYLNNTQQLFDLGGLNGWALQPLYETYASWGYVTLSIAVSQQYYGFSIGSKGLDYNYTTHTGWLACDWWHNTPQLFWLFGEEPYYPYKRPSSCSQVELIPEYI